MVTENSSEQKPLTEETLENIESKIKDIQGKADATAEEKESLSSLKEERQTRYQKRIDKLHSEKLAEAERASKLERELDEQKRKLEEVESRTSRSAKPELTNDLIDVGGKKFYSDDSLTAQVSSGELTAQQAYAHQQQRIKAEIKFEMKQEAEERETKNKTQKDFEEDKADVLKKYPHFAPGHRDHDPEDPLYKLSSEIWAEGYRSNPRGLSLAINRAKQILRYNEERPDVSEDLSVGKVRGQGESRETTRDAILSADEKDSAVRLYCLGGAVNPITGKQYTEAEAIAKATKAKNARMRR